MKRFFLPLLIISTTIIAGQRAQLNFAKNLDFQDKKVGNIFQNLPSNISSFPGSLSDYFNKPQPATSSGRAASYCSIGEQLIYLGKHDEAEKVLICVTEKKDLPHSLNENLHHILAHLYEATEDSEKFFKHKFVAATFWQLAYDATLM